MIAAIDEPAMEAAPLIAHIFWTAHSPAGATSRTPSGKPKPRTNPTTPVSRPAAAIRPPDESICLRYDSPATPRTRSARTATLDIQTAPGRGSENNGRLAVCTLRGPA